MKNDKLNWKSCSSNGSVEGNWRRYRERIRSGGCGGSRQLCVSISKTRIAWSTTLRKRRRKSCRGARQTSRRRSEVERLFAAAEKAFGKIDILVNNAGVYEFVPLEEVTEQQFHRMFDTNVLGMLLVTQEGAEAFQCERRQHHQHRFARQFSDSADWRWFTTQPKAAVDAITRTLAKELGPRKIRVNSINPGMVITEGVVTGGFHESDMRNIFESMTPLGRVGQTDDIAPAAVFFASDDSAWITGETLVIAGGLR